MLIHRIAKEGEAIQTLDTKFPSVQLVWWDELTVAHEQ